MPKSKWEIFNPGQSEFYEYQQSLESIYISPEERLAEINKAVITSSQAVEDLQNSVNNPSFSLEQKSLFGGQLDEYKNYQAKLQEALKTKSYDVPLQIRDMLPEPIMSVDDYRSIISVKNIIDLRPNQREFIDALYEKYTGRGFKAFKELPVSLQEKYLGQMKSMMEQTLEKDQILSNEKPINLPYKAYVWRSGTEIKWFQEIWDKFGGKTGA